MHNDLTRRSFLRTAPLAAAAATLTLPEAATAQAAPVPYQIFPAEKLAEDAQALQAAPGNNNLFMPAGLPFNVVLTTEVAKAAKEFEYHEGRDHILQVIDGTTLYEIGGTPVTPRNTKPGEWLAPSSTGAAKLTLHKGDLLIIPRNTPHKRTTETSVTFTLISTTGK